MLRALIFALASLGIAVTGSLFLNSGHSTAVNTFSPELRSNWVEPGSEDSNEQRREHYRDPSGSRRVEIFYHIDKRGTLHFRPDGTLKSELYTTKDGRLLKRAEYALDGKYVEDGVEQRLDGSVIWQTEKSDDSRYISTVVFWRDGKTVFSRVVRDKVEQRRSLYQHDSTGQVRLLTVHNSKDKNILRQVEYDADGNVSRERTNLSEDLKKDGADVVFYRADGSVLAKQLWRNVTLCFGPEGCSESFMATRVLLMSADGKTVQREIVMSEYSSTPKMVIDFKVDGSQVKNLLKSIDGQLSADSYLVTEVTRLDAAGKELGTQEFKADFPIVKIDPKFRQDLEIRSDLLKSWFAVEEAKAGSE